jgi:hypothetical protein
VNEVPLTGARRAAGLLFDWACELFAASYAFDVADAAGLFAVLALALPWEIAWLRLFGATPGHLLVGIRVRAEGGARPSLRQATRRTVMRLALAASDGRAIDRWRRSFDDPAGMSTAASPRGPGARAALGAGIVLLAVVTLVGLPDALWPGPMVSVVAGVLMLVDPLVEPQLVLNRTVPLRELRDQVVAEAPPPLRSPE